MFGVHQKPLHSIVRKTAYFTTATKLTIPTIHSQWLGHCNLKRCPAVASLLFLLLFRLQLRTEPYTTTATTTLEQQQAVAQQVPQFEPINIILSVDETQLDGILPVILSTAKHTHHPVHFYLVWTSTTEDDDKNILTSHSHPVLLKKKLANCTMLQGYLSEDNDENESSQIKIRIVQPTASQIPLHMVHSRSHARLATAGNFARFNFAQLLPDLDYAIYMDTDVLVVGDVAEVWDMLKKASDDHNNSNNSIGTCVAVERKRPINLDFNKEKAGKVAQMYYERYGRHIDLQSNGFNAGIWGVNLRRWVDRQYTQEAEWWLKANDEHSLWILGTQPVMLIVLYNDWISLPSEWNVEGLGWKNPAENILKSAKLLHWNGRNKPWLSDRPPPPRQMLWRHYTCPSQRAAISMDDPVPGWAGMNQSTIVTNNDDDACTIQVQTAQELHDHLKSTASSSASALTCPKVLLLLEPGVYSGSFKVQRSHVTIIGTKPGVLIFGNLYISGVSYVTVRNLAVKGLPCFDYEDCKWGPDAIGVRDDAHHVWLDHLDVSDGQDGNLDITRGADYVTASWCIFRYTNTQKPHRFSNLIGGSDDEDISRGKLHITYMNCWWGDHVAQRTPRGRFGDDHLFNNLFSGAGHEKKSGIGIGEDISIIVENSIFRNSNSTNIVRMPGTARGFKFHNNKGIGIQLSGTIFDIPYEYTRMQLGELENRLTSPSCGAGNSCLLQKH